MLKSFTYQPVTETSRPFAAAAETCGFAEKGYIEDEYFQTGTANVYEKAPTFHRRSSIRTPLTPPGC